MFHLPYSRGYKKLSLLESKLSYCTTVEALQATYSVTTVKLLSAVHTVASLSHTIAKTIPYSATFAASQPFPPLSVRRAASAMETTPSIHYSLSAAPALNAYLKSFKNSSPKRV
jgi:hypothetical protein